MSLVDHIDRALYAVEQHPWIAVAVALVVGTGIGALL